MNLYVNIANQSMLAKHINTGYYILKKQNAFFSLISFAASQVEN